MSKFDNSLEVLAGLGDVIEQQNKYINKLEDENKFLREEIASLTNELNSSRYKWWENNVR